MHIMHIRTVLCSLVLLALLAPLHAFAQACAPATETPPAWNETRIHWLPPTRYTDGALIEPGTALTYTVYVGQTPARACTTDGLDVALPDQPEGLQFYRVTTRVAPAGVESDYSNAATKLIEMPVPPGEPQIDAGGTVYQLVQTDDNIAVIAVGTVGSATPCTLESLVADGVLYNVVPRAAANVTWYGNVQPRAVYGQCH